MYNYIHELSVFYDILGLMLVVQAHIVTHESEALIYNCYCSVVNLNKLVGWLVPNNSRLIKNQLLVN